MDTEIKQQIAKPIFLAMIDNLPENYIKKVFLQVNESEYWNLLPKRIREDKQFLQECLEKGLITSENIPDNLKNKDFVSYERYIELIKSDPYVIKENLYPQDRSIVLAALKYAREHDIKDRIFNLIDEGYRRDIDVIAEAVKSNPDLLYYMDKNTSSKVRDYKDVMETLISQDTGYFYELKDKQKFESRFLKIMLKNIPLYEEVKEYLKKNKDPEIALMALKLTRSSIDYLYPTYRDVAKASPSKQNSYAHLKTYLINHKLRENGKKDNKFTV